MDSNAKENNTQEDSPKEGPGLVPHGIVYSHIARARSRKGMDGDFLKPCYFCAYKASGTAKYDLDCEFVDLQDELKCHGERLHESITKNRRTGIRSVQSSIRKALYSYYKEHRQTINAVPHNKWKSQIIVPTCVEAGIKNLFPDPCGVYNFFRMKKREAVHRNEKEGNGDGK